MHDKATPTTNPGSALVPGAVARPGFPVEVTVLEWPEQQPLRSWLAEARLPRILVLGSSASPPPDLDDLEDWVRVPVRPGELDARAEVLLRRGMRGLAAAPVLDADGLLRHGSRWVAIPDRQLEVVRLLLANLGRVVAMAVVRATYEAAGGSGHPNAMRTLVTRLKRRVRTVGLRLDAVRGRGIVLAVAPAREP